MNLESAPKLEVTAVPKKIQKKPVGKKERQKKLGNMGKPIDWKSVKDLVPADVTKMTEVVKNNVLAVMGAINDSLNQVSIINESLNQTLITKMRSAVSAVLAGVKLDNSDSVKTHLMSISDVLRKAGVEIKDGLIVAQPRKATVGGREFNGILPTAAPAEASKSALPPIDVSRSGSEVYAEVPVVAAAAEFDVEGKPIAVSAMVGGKTVKVGAEWTPEGNVVLVQPVPGLAFSVSPSGDIGVRNDVMLPSGSILYFQVDASENGATGYASAEIPVSGAFVFRPAASISVAPGTAPDVAGKVVLEVRIPPV